MGNIYIAVMDYSIGKVKVYEAFELVETYIENFIEKQGHNLKDCYYMTTKENPIAS